MTTRNPNPPLILHPNSRATRIPSMAEIIKDREQREREMRARLVRAARLER